MSSQRARAAARQAFPDRSIVGIDDLNRGRGVFSEVHRVEFAPGDGPPAVAVKLAVAGPNGEAARRSGAYAREAVAYRSLLPHLDVAVPVCHAVIDDPLGPTFVLEDLSTDRAVDQLDGLEIGDAVAVAEVLGRLHRSSRASAIVARAVDHAQVRTNTVASLDPTALRLGITTLDERWRDTLDDDQRTAFRQLVEVHSRVADRFAAAGPPVLCHGDPRADNLAFRGCDDVPVLFDWQQIALQPGVGDLAWMAATSLEPDVRRIATDALLDAYRTAGDVEIDREDLRAGFALPGLAVLYLAQRQADDARTVAFIATSLRRIGQALVDLDVPGVVAS